MDDLKCFLFVFEIEIKKGRTKGNNRVATSFTVHLFESHHNEKKKRHDENDNKNNHGSNFKVLLEWK